MVRYSFIYYLLNNVGATNGNLLLEVQKASEKEVLYHWQLR